MMHQEQIGPHLLMCADARECIDALAFDVLITDPPYGLDLGANADTRGGRHGLAKGGYGSYDDTIENFRLAIVPTLKTALARARAKRGAIFSNHNIHELPKPDAIGGVFLPSAQGRHCWGFNSFSPVAFYGTAPALNKGSRPSAIRSVEAAEKNGHPCNKPIGWMMWLVSHASDAGECVLDPFMGSGTTGVACARLGRPFVGIELDPKYYDIACRRVAAAVAQPDLFVTAKAPREKPQQLPL